MSIGAQDTGAESTTGGAVDAVTVRPTDPESDTLTREQAVSGRLLGSFRRVGPDLLVAAGYVTLAMYLTVGLWTSPHRRVLAFLGGADPILAQWWLAHAAHAVAHLENPFFTTDLNAPLGVDLAGNASFIGVGIPLAPLTWLFGAGVTSCVVVVANFALTALAWYWLFSRPLRLRRSAAVWGGLFCGFAPPLVGIAADGEQHITAGFLLPFIIWRFVRIATGGRPVRDGVLLGLLVVWQALIGEEILLLGALALGAFAVAYAVQRPRELRAMAPALVRGLPVAVVVAVVLLAVPLWYQFAGPQHLKGNPIDPQGFADRVVDYVGIPTPRPFWSIAAGGRLAVERPVIGLPLLAVLVAFSWPLRRNVMFRTVLAVLAVMLVLSLGTHITLNHHPSRIPGPWRLVAHLPVFQWVIPLRVGLMVVPAVGCVIAYLVDRAVGRWREGVRLVPVTVVAATVMALAVTLASAPLPTITWAPTPHFVTSGTWRSYVPAGRSLVTVPAPSLASFDGMRWAVASGGDMVLPGGYFLGPNPDDNGRTTLFGTSYRWSTRMWIDVLQTGRVAPAQPGDRDRLLADLRFWRAGVVVLVPTADHADALRASVEQFLGPPQRVDDVWLWDLRGLV